MGPIAFRNRRRSQSQGDHVRKGLAPFEAQAVLPGSQFEPDCLFPDGAARVPRSGAGPTDGSLRTTVNAQFHRSGRARRILNGQPIATADRQFKVVFDNDGRPPPVGNHRAGVGPLVRKHPDVAAIEGPGRDVEAPRVAGRESQAEAEQQKCFHAIAESGRSFCGPACVPSMPWVRRRVPPVGEYRRACDRDPRLRWSGSPHRRSRAIASRSGRRPARA